MAETIRIDRISMEGTQARAELNQIIIGEYSEAYEQGVDLPPIDVYFDQETYWLGDGFHRVKAAQHIGRDSITANVHLGSRRDAILHAVGANEEHGLRRTNADRRKAVALMLDDPEWRAWANTEIARQCNVSEYLVRMVRSELMPAEAEPVKEKTRKVRRGSQTFDQNVTRIGRSRSQKEAAVTVSQDDGLQQHEAVSQAPALSSIKSKIESGLLATAAPEESPVVITPVTSTEPDIPEAVNATHSHLEPPEPETILETAAADHEPAAPLEALPVSLPSAEFEPGPVKLTPGTVATGRITFDLQATTISEELVQQVTLGVRWEYATPAEQEAFVADHREELQKILEKLGKKLDRQKTATS
jgi:hypothetical protein